MAPDDDDDVFENTDPLNAFPGLPTTELQPLGVPVPAPLTPFRGPSGDTDDHPQPADTSLDQIEQVIEAGESYIDHVEAAMDEESCEMCEAILDTLRTRPLEEQVQGVRELAELKEAAAQGADPAELAEVMEGFEVVDDPMNMA